jgi:Tfp pilus assembly protein PilX
MLKRFGSDESGLAMIVAIMVSFIVFLLSIFVVQLSIHNSTQSAYDRKRVQSVDAAEAGLDAAWNSIEGTAPTSLPCGSAATGTLSTSPGTSSYSVDFAYYNASGTALVGCPSQSNVPTSVLLTSTGKTDGGVVRKMQSYATLTPTYSGIGAAILTQNGTSLQNNFTVSGNLGSDADIYVLTGDLNLTNSPNIYGNIYIPNGGFTSANNNVVYGNVWANTAVSINTPARVTGSVTSSTSSISGTGAIAVDATAGTTIASGLTVTGNRYPGTVQGPPPTQSFPYVCYDNTVSPNCTPQNTSWTSKGYVLHSFSDCASALTYLKSGTITGDVVVRITAVCPLSIGLNDTITFPGNLAIITNGSITMANQNNWTGPVGGNKSLFFLVNYQSTSMNCASGNYNITTGNNSNFNNVSTSFYSPCTVTITNQNSFSGQIIGGTVNTANNFTLNFKPVLIPGAAEKVTGFSQSIAYIREVS